MNTIRRIVPALVVLVVLVASALAIGLLGRGGQQNAPLTDTGPNAGLSNEELVSVAITNMKALESYHFEFKGGLPSMSVQMSPNLSITGDVQLHGKGSRYRVRDEGGPPLGGPGLILDVGNGVDAVATTSGSWYQSYDGGKTWAKPSGDTPLGFLLAGLECAWGNRWAGEETQSDPSMCEGLAGQVDFTDGTPRLEKVDDVITRHMVGEYRGQQEQASGGTVKVDIWVSTEQSPTIRRLRVAGTTTVPEHNPPGSTRAAAFSPDSAILAVAHGHRSDWTVRLWDMTRPESEPRRLVSNVGPFSSVAFSPDGKTLVAASANRSEALMQLFLWDVANLDAEPTILKSRSLSDYPGTLDYWDTSVAFSPDGEMVAANAPDGIYLWKTPYRGAEPTILQSSPDGTLAFSPDGTTLAAGDSQAGVYLFDIRSPEKPPRTLSHGAELRAVAFSPDGRLLASHGKKEVALWDLQQPKPVPTILPGDPEIAQTLAFSPDSKMLAASGESGVVRLWDLSREVPDHSTPKLTLEGGDNGYAVYAVSFSSDGKLFAATNFEGEARVWKVRDLQAGSSPEPTVLKDEERAINKPFTLTWTWSRFNEDFGEVSPPEGVAPSRTAGVAGSEATPAPVKEYHMASYDSDIKVNADGSLDIVETLTFVFTSGTFRRGLRTWDLDGRASITVKGVTEVPGEGYTKGDFDPDDSTTGIAGTYGIEESGSELRLRWVYGPTTNSTRTFQVAYHVEGAIVARESYYQLRWYAVPPRWNAPINQSRVAVTFPEGSDTTRWSVDAQPRGAEMSTQGNTITWRMSSRLDDGFEVGVRVPKDALDLTALPTETIR